MHILFVNACIRGAASRTAKLASPFLETLLSKHPNAELEIVNLNTVQPVPLFEDTFIIRETATAARDWEHPCFDLANQFLHADFVVIAAPFWEGTFPAALHTYIEHICVPGLTFSYDANGAPVGRCRAKHAVFFTTKGGIYSTEPACHDDFAARFLHTNLCMLGIPNFHVIEAEGLDLVGNDVSAILQRAQIQSRTLADTLSKIL